MNTGYLARVLLLSRVVPFVVVEVSDRPALFFC